MKPARPRRSAAKADQLAFDLSAPAAWRPGGVVSEGDVALMSHGTLVAFYWQAGWLYENRNDSFMTDGAWD